MFQDSAIRLTRKISLLFLAGYATLGYAGIAYADAAPTSTKIKQVFVSDGSPISFDDAGTEITPINGWEVSTAGVISVVMQEPAGKIDPKSDEPTFRRNITVAAIHKGLPIDSERGVNLKQKLTDKFGKSASISNFAINDAQFFDYKGTKDGIILYSDFTYKNFEMRQMHVLVGGAENQFLMTYTDFKKDFEAQTPIVSAAWQSMSSIQVTGEAPVRYQSLYSYGPVALAIAFLALILMLLRSMKNKALLRKVVAEADQVDGDFEEYQSTTAWNLIPSSKVLKSQVESNYSSFGTQHSETLGSYTGISTF